MGKQSTAQLLIEQRASSGSFGKGRKMPMSFGKFCKQLQGGDESLYLSSQQVSFVADAVMTAFITLIV